MFTFYMNKRAQGLFDPGCEPTLAGTEEKVLDMRKTAVFLLCLMVVPGFAHAAVDCSSTTVPQAAPLRPTVIAPVSSELAASAYQLGTQVSVLSQAYDESQSADQVRSEEHTSELQSLMRISYAVFCLKKKQQQKNKSTTN